MLKNCISVSQFRYLLLYRFVFFQIITHILFINQEQILS